jgi:hypothetical protein
LKENLVWPDLNVRVYVGKFTYVCVCKKQKEFVNKPDLEVPHEHRCERVCVFERNKIR